MFLIAHKTPISKPMCDRLAASGANMFEVDIKMSASRLVVSHFLPTLGVAGWIENDGMRFRTSRRALQDPVLDDVNALIPPQASVLLDLKESAPGRRMEVLLHLERLTVDRDRFAVSSPASADLAQLRSLGFTTWKSVGSKRTLRRVLRAGDPPYDAVTVRHSLLNGGVISALKERAVEVIAWTVNDVRRAVFLRDLGVSGITTDREDVLSTLRPAQQVPV